MQMRLILDKTATNAASLVSSFCPSPFSGALKGSVQQLLPGIVTKKKLIGSENAFCWLVGKMDERDSRIEMWAIRLLCKVKVVI